MCPYELIFHQYFAGKLKISVLCQTKLKKKYSFLLIHSKGNYTFDNHLVKLEEDLVCQCFIAGKLQKINSFKSN